MTHKFLAMASALLLMLSTVVACSDDTDLYTIGTQDCMVKAVTLGTLYRTIHTKDAKGEDSTYTVTVQGSYFPMSIDQINNRIFNADSLPYGTDISRVVFSTFSTTGVIGIKALISGKDSIFTYTDTTNFATPKPREISVYTTDGLRRRTYTVELRVHQQEGDVWNWQNIKTEPLLNGLSDIRTLIVADSLYVWGKKGDLQCVVAKAPTGNLQEWQSANIPLDIITSSIYVSQGMFYTLSEGSVVKSTDGENWTATGCVEKFDHIVAAGTKQIFAIKSAELYSSSDGINWAISKAYNADQLTANAYAGLLLEASSDSIESILLLAANNAVTNVWKKDIDLSTKNPYHFDWIFYPRTEDAFPCPLIDDMQLTRYNGSVLLTGTTNGKSSPLYVSADKGRTWRTNDDYMLPTTGNTGVASIVSDSNDFLYAIYPESGEIWRGRINRLGWESKK